MEENGRDGISKQEEEIERRERIEGEKKGVLKMRDEATEIDDRNTGIDLNGGQRKGRNKRTRRKE